MKHSGPTPADYMAPQNNTDCGSFTLDFLDFMPRHSSSRLWDPSVCGGSWCSNSSLSPLLVKRTLLNGLFLIIFSRLRSSLLLVHLFLPHFSLPLNFLLMCIDTTLREHPTSLAITFKAFPPCGGCQWWFPALLSGQHSSPWLLILMNQTRAGVGLIFSPGVSCLRPAHFRSQPFILK